jgi:hypothetical protein
MLGDFLPVYDFHEVHRISIDARPERSWSRPAGFVPTSFLSWSC